MSEQPPIEWLCMAAGQVPDESSRDYQIVMSYLEDNHYSTVVDLEEEEI